MTESRNFIVDRSLHYTKVHFAVQCNYAVEISCLLFKSRVLRMYDIKDDDIYAAFNTSGHSTSNASIEKQLPVLELVKVCPLISPFDLVQVRYQ